MALAEPLLGEEVVEALAGVLDTEVLVGEVVVALVLEP
jgi:hypothetical protein